MQQYRCPPFPRGIQHLSLSTPQFLHRHKSGTPATGFFLFCLSAPVQVACALSHFQFRMLSAELAPMRFLKFRVAFPERVARQCNRAAPVPVPVPLLVPFFQNSENFLSSPSFSMLKFSDFEIPSQLQSLISQWVVHYITRMFFIDTLTTYSTR